MNDATAVARRTRPRILVSGYMIRLPLAGNVFAYFHYVVGLRRLGYEVAYVEESGWDNSCFDPVTWSPSDDAAGGVELVRRLFDAHGLHDVPIAFANRARGQVWGCDDAELGRLIGAADLLLNVGGVCWLEEFARVPRRAMIDMDPLFTQVGRFGGALLERHHVHFSYGTNIGRPDCSVPTAGIAWQPIVPPVVIDIWPIATPPADAPFTTIANWDAYGGITHDGEHYGQKSAEFLRIIDLPSRTCMPLELALSGADEPTRARLRSAGWRIANATEISRDVATYQAYIARSRGEFSVAKNAYVKTRSGWFSDRSACYLAAGLPVVVQETGIGESIPTGKGLLAFSDLDGAADALARVGRNHALHAAAARELARSHFDYRVVLPAMLSAATGGRA